MPDIFLKRDNNVPLSDTRYCRLRFRNRQWRVDSIVDNFQTVGAKEGTPSHSLYCGFILSI